MLKNIIFRKNIINIYNNLLNKTKMFLTHNKQLQLIALALKTSRLQREFKSSTSYWIQRYAIGRNSGPGSYNNLAEYKARMINSFIKEQNLITVVELGCGDGNQLQYSVYPNYIGYDISVDAIERCRRLFQADKTKSFNLMSDFNAINADVTLSLDVIYHLVEDSVFCDYMDKLFMAKKFVIIYSSNTDKQDFIQAPHVFHRKFTDYVEKTFPRWCLLSYFPNPYPYNNNRYVTTFCNFFIFRKINS